MKKQGLKPTASSYTSLFTACMESPVPSHSLQRAKKLHEEITRRLSNQDLQLHVITCNAAMKAFAVCGSPLTAFEIYEEMQDYGIKPDVHTYSMLLTACAHDNTGSDKALRILEEMKAHGVKPDIFIYNWVLKVMRNVAVSALNVPQDKEEHQHATAGDIVENVNALQSLPNKQNNFGSSVVLSENNSHASEDIQQSNKDSDTSTQFHEAKLELENNFPGVEEFLQAMAMDDVEPDIRTFHLLLQLAGSGYAVDKKYLMQMMKEFGVKPDNVFQNTLVKQTVQAGELQQAKVIKFKQVQVVKTISF